MVNQTALMRFCYVNILFWLFILLLKSDEVFVQKKSYPLFAASVDLQRHIPIFNKQINKFQIFRFSSEQHSKYVQSTTHSCFRLNLIKGVTRNVELEHANIMATNYKLQLLTSIGLQTISSNSSFLYKERVNGVENSDVRLAIKEDLLYGSIYSQDKEYFIELVRSFSGKAGIYEFIFYDIQFISVADFSVFQKFNQDVYKVEAALLANLNVA